MTVLRRPTPVVDLRRAPTTEQAGLAELARLDDHDEVLRALTRIAESVRTEDEERAKFRHTMLRIHDDLAVELSREERLRLLIRVMCELVAYGEDDAVPAT
jgi:hypothetical protein